MLKILVVYWYNAPTMRITTEDHLYCFRRHLPHHVTYLNVEEDVDAEALRGSDYDIIMFHDLFFCGRWGGPPLFHKLSAKIQVLREHSAVKIAVPQDEFMSADLLCEFINNFGVQAVFSVTPASEWPKVYRDIDRDRVRLYCVLTGYLEDATLATIEKHAADAPHPRPIGIGYRAGGRNWRQASWLGRHGILKIDIADRFAEAAPRFDISTDISTRSEDTFMGEEWCKFLLRCDYTIGLEGGASLLDWDGTIRPKTLTFVDENPHATLEEIEAACFPGLDGTLALFALSPRHLEACATRTCQILVEGDYNGVLQPWQHYLPVKKDFSDLDSVLLAAKDETRRAEIVEQAYRDIVASRRYTYKMFAEFIVDETRKLAPDRLGRGDSRTAYSDGHIESTPGPRAWAERVIHAVRRFGRPVSH